MPRVAFEEMTDPRPSVTGAEKRLRYPVVFAGANSSFPASRGLGRPSQHDSAMDGGGIVVDSSDVMGMVSSIGLSSEPTTSPAPLFGRVRAAQQAHHLPLEFSGTGAEYFRIWIVNLLLTLLTLLALLTALALLTLLALLALLPGLTLLALLALLTRLPLLALLTGLTLLPLLAFTTVLLPLLTLLALLPLLAVLALLTAALAHALVE